MALDKNSNGFTYGFAFVMVVVVGAVLSIAAIGLKPYQKDNQKQEKMKNILTAIEVMSADDNMKDAPAKFEQHVIERFVLNYNGDLVSSSSEPVDPKNPQDAFNIDVQKEYKALGIEDRNYPLYKCEKDGKTYWVVPMVGTGLWGPIWGFIALENDMNTIYGANFDHKTETPGLGAEINKSQFQKQFKGDMIYNNSSVALSIIKGGTDASNKYGVDAITGGTITSNGVGEMIQRTFEIYKPFFQTRRS